MKPERAFIAERPLAQHAPELLRQAGAAELLPLLNRLGERWPAGWRPRWRRCWAARPRW
jgi:flagellar motor switch protein FliM